MRVHICAMGRLKGGPEAELIADYVQRFDKTGRALSLGPLTLHQLDDRKGGGMEAEAVLLEKSIPPGAQTIALDERGTRLTSREFAAQLADLRDAGTRDLAFLIGGADGLAAHLRKGSAGALSLGRMVWPHKLARVMLCEQLYRAASILAGTPYHRD
ncbi:23S rRNA (pseudouridine(1915)-N(3))-methyltransferase RlmH [Pseudaestuariivita sp.]|uniref:23S rRNA (pseudouridine(1915)-N(3))-methyltransferase RlmH n=1 Tax=Pseudaestuariivita sp. TaxID=2211669 RepID=UPI004059542A